MRERITAGALALALAVALLINFHGPADAALLGPLGNGSTGTTSRVGGTTSGSTTGRGSVGTGSGGTGSGANSTTGNGPTGSGSTAAGGTSGGGSTAAGQFTGPDIPFPYGDVQVQITVKAGKITDVQALSMPVGGHSGRISSYVAPILRSQALSAQSANINGVSGASYTSQAYAMSLQGAIDAAGL
jgi:uncharacterized protein with FMN-binding domain